MYALSHPDVTVELQTMGINKFELLVSRVSVKTELKFPGKVFKSLNGKRRLIHSKYSTEVAEIVRKDLDAAAVPVAASSSSVLGAQGQAGGSIF